MMIVTVVKPLNVRLGRPGVNADKVRVLPVGTQLEVSDETVLGESISGNPVWLQDNAGNFYWSGGTNYSIPVVALPVAKLILYQASHFRNVRDSNPCRVDQDFALLLDKMNLVAQEFGILVRVTSSYREDANVSGAIVVPAKKSNHMVGHAIDCNLHDIASREDFNSRKMGDGKGKDEQFIRAVVRQTGLRWGGSFNTPDTVHFDDGLNLSNKVLWEQKYRALRTG